MGWLKKKKELRANEISETSGNVDDLLLRALLGKTPITKEIALNIPSLNGCINYIANTVSMLPIKLYKAENGKVTEIKDDPRLRILNDDPGDTLDAVQFWRAMIIDYHLGKGGYAYIDKRGNRYYGLYYVREENISIQKNNDPIFKDYNIVVNGKTYYPFQFLKILRNTRDGMTGVSLINEVTKILSVSYNSLVFEDNLVSKGGNKKGFLKSQKKLTDEALTNLKDAFKKLYSNSEENVVVLNDGLDFKESSNSSVEMQLNENKATNSGEICKLFNVPESIIKGTATEKDYIYGFKLAVLPILRAIECALNRDFLLEKEKNTYYWAFDTKEVTKGDIKTRYEAYKIGIEAKFLQPDEVRYMEDLEPLGFDMIQLNLGDVFFNPKTREIYIPNTGETKNVDVKGGENNADRNKS